MQNSASSANGIGWKRVRESKCIRFSSLCRRTAIHWTGRSEWACHFPRSINNNNWCLRDCSQRSQTGRHAAGDVPASQISLCNWKFNAIVRQKVFPRGFKQKTRKRLVYGQRIDFPAKKLTSATCLHRINALRVCWLGGKSLFTCCLSLRMCRHSATADRIVEHKKLNSLRKNGRIK